MKRDQTRYVISQGRLIFCIYPKCSFYIVMPHNVSIDNEMGPKAQLRWGSNGTVILIMVHRRNILRKYRENIDIWNLFFWLTCDIDMNKGDAYSEITPWMEQASDIWPQFRKLLYILISWIQKWISCVQLWPQ